MYLLPMARVVPRLVFLVLFLCAFQSQAAPVAWKDDLQPLPKETWNRERAAHLLERAGFGATPSEVNRLAAMTSEQAVRYLVRYQRIKQTLPLFEPSYNLQRAPSLTDPVVLWCVVSV